MDQYVCAANSTTFTHRIVQGFALLLVLKDVARGSTQKPEGLDPEEAAEWEDEDPLLNRAFNLYMLVLWVLWQVLLCARLDDNIHTSYVLVMIPYFIYVRTSIVYFFLEGNSFCHAFGPPCSFPHGRLSGVA